MFLCRRQREAELKQVEELAARRVEELVAKRVEEELERRKDEIEAEVLRRVEEAKCLMEEQMLEELEKKRKEQEEEQKKREASLSLTREGRGFGGCNHVTVAGSDNTAFLHIIMYLHIKHSQSPCKGVIITFIIS